MLYLLLHNYNGRSLTTFDLNLGLFHATVVDVHGHASWQPLLVALDAFSKVGIHEQAAIFMIHHDHCRLGTFAVHIINLHVIYAKFGHSILSHLCVGHVCLAVAS